MADCVVVSELGDAAEVPDADEEDEDDGGDSGAGVVVVSPCSEDAAVVGSLRATGSPLGLTTTSWILEAIWMRLSSP